jgi:hypothetical protein
VLQDAVAFAAEIPQSAGVRKRFKRRFKADVRETPITQFFVTHSPSSL